MGLSLLQRHRNFLKDSIRQQIDFSQTDQARGESVPPIEKPAPDQAETIELTRPSDWENRFRIDLRLAVQNRRSRRKYSDAMIAFDELSFLLWATQGTRERIHPSAVYRHVPSAGCRHAFETYLLVSRVQSLKSGINGILTQNTVPFCT